MKLRIINTNFNNAYMNMAIDEALLISELPVLRFYRWKPACLSLGYFQKINQINIKECKKQGIDIVRRLTGGDAVLHDKELTYSFIIDEKLMPKSVIDSYKIISKGIVNGLGTIGLKAKMNANIKKNNKSAICYHNPSWYEIVVNNKKIVGSAQKRINGRILQHGSILLDIDIGKLVSLFKFKNKKIIEYSLKNRITSINKERENLKNKFSGVHKYKLYEQLNKKIDYYDITTAMEIGFKENFNAKIIKDRLTKEEIELADKLIAKYSRKDWNCKF